MGRFRAESVVIKELRRTGLKIVFFNRESIYIYDDTHGWTVFHRWFAPKGSYNGGWRQFRHLLWYGKNTTYEHCYQLAFRWDIPSQKAYHPPDLTNIKVEERFVI